MRPFTKYTFWALCALVLIKAGCSDVNNAPPPGLSSGIQSVIPAEGPVGTRVLIGGKGFDEVQQVLFNGTEAQIESASDTTVTTRVPQNATSGIVEVVTSSQTLTGPAFSVDSTESVLLSIDNVEPEIGRYRDTVRITGNGFKLPLLSNTIFFGDTETSPISVNDSVMTTTVPENAITGLLSVVAEQDTAIGPTFTVIKHTIDEVSPQSGLVGTEVLISGSNFSTQLAENKVLFNGMEAEVAGGSKTQLTTFVPGNASSGPVSVVVRQDTVQGPVFTVQSLTITGISPESGPTGTQVIITGEGFSAVSSENIVTFNGERAELSIASPSQLVAFVPGSATTGPVEVIVDGQIATGPIFTVEEPKSLEIIIETSGSDLDTGYNLIVEGQDDRIVKPNDTVIYSDLLTDQLQVELSDVAGNCSVAGENPRTVSLDSEATSTTFSVMCSPPAPQISGISPTSGPTGTRVTISGSNFSPIANDNIVTFNGERAELSSASPSQLVSFVPGSATTGPVEVTVDGNTAVGPTFTVDAGAPVITSLTPDGGTIGTQVTISGMNFSATASENTITFNGTQAPVNSATTTELMTQVPDGATDGPIVVTVAGQSGTGPDFDVITSGTLEVIIATSGEDQDPDGYLLSVDESGGISTEINETINQPNLEAGIHQVGLSDIADNCFISQDRSNPYDVDIAAGQTTTTNIDVICEPGNIPPVAEFTFECTNLTCDFDASGSSDSDGFISVYRWSFGDGTSSVEPGPVTSHSFESPGIYAVEFTAQDNEGGQDIITKNVTVTVMVLEISSISPTSGPTGTQVTITGSNFSPTANDNIVTFNGERAELSSASSTQLISLYRVLQPPVR